MSSRTAAIRPLKIRGDGMKAYGMELPPFRYEPALQLESLPAHHGDFKGAIARCRRSGPGASSSILRAAQASSSLRKMSKGLEDASAAQ